MLKTCIKTLDMNSNITPHCYPLTALNGRSQNFASPIF